MTSQKRGTDASIEAGKFLQQLRSKASKNLAYLYRVWRAHNPEHWSDRPEIYRLLGEKVLGRGEPLLAYDIVSEGMKWFPQDASLRQLVALALARSGAAQQANLLLTELYREGHRDEETLGILARTHKDLAAEATASSEREQHLRRAYELYASAYETTGGYWSGINAATLACLLDEERKAATIAAQVQRQCEALLRKRTAKTGERHWLLSTLGEAALLQKDWDVAARRYQEAVRASRGDWGSVQSTRHNARLLLAHFGADDGRFAGLFRFPTVIVFSGHIVDRPGRPSSRFPAELEGAVKEEIRSRIARLNGRFGYASAASGADILFHEAMLETGGEAHVVLPYEREQFMESSVRIVEGDGWVERFHRILAKAVDVQELSGRGQQDEVAAFDYANRMLDGMARLRAQRLETQLVPLAVWDGQSGDAPGGTADNIARWRRLGLQPEVVDLRQLRASSSRPAAGVHRTKVATRRKPRRRFRLDIRALLFADFEGFSSLSDAEVPQFVTHCLGLVRKVIARSSTKPLMKNTWGDGLYLVFATMREAGEFALDLRDAIRQVRWEGKGLPPMKVRIGLHAGPVFYCTDPVTGLRSYTGAHVSRAARIEPITPAGQVYASQPFAALAAAEGVKEFRCDYVGQTSLAKRYGTFPIFVVLRHSAGVLDA